MAKRRKPAAKPDFDALMELCEKHAGMGVSTELHDLVTWVDDDFEISYWRLALERIDRWRDKRLLLNLLRQNEELLEQIEADVKDKNFYTDDFTPTARHHLANLLKRHNLKLSPSGRRKSPLENSPWQQALSAIYTNGDKQPLIKLLESAAEISLADRSDFAYLLEQYDLTRPRGRREQPSYELSPIEKKLLVAGCEVRSSVQAGQTVKDAVTRVARERGLGYDQLYNSYAGTRGGTRRAIKRAKE